MARYIDTDKLKDKIRPYYDKVLHQNISGAEKLAKHDMISDVMFEINEQPTADVQEVINQLQTENAELKARLDKAVEIPCEFGDTVYVLMQRNVIIEVVKGTFKNVRRYDDDVWWVEFSDLWIDKTLDDFGKTVFLTEAEAQAKLDEMKGGAK